MTAARCKGLSAFLESAALILAFIAFFGITAAGFFVTCAIEIDWASQNTERVLFLPDNVAVNLIVLAVALCLILMLLRTDIKKHAVTAVTAGMALAVIAVGFWFTENAYATPGADALALVDTAREILSGNLDSIRGSYYLRTFPFQMGFLLFLEGFFRVFGPESLLLLQKCNVVLLALSNVAIVRIAHLLFENRKVTLLTALFTLLFIQPVFLTTFIYGNIPGMFFAFLAILFAIRALRGQPGFYIPSAIAIALATILKMNFSIVMIAMVIVLLLTALKNKKSLPALAAVGMIVLTIAAGRLPQKIYESRAGVSLGAGTPQGAWLVTGFRESSLCSGWYNSYTTTVLMGNGYDQERTRAQVKADFEERLAIFRARPRYAAAFFGKKLISQWQEPSYQSIWSSAAGTHSQAVPAAVESIYTGKTGQALAVYFNHLMQLIYAAFLLGLIALFKNRNLPALMLPLVLLGAAIYHLLFEAKAQYVLVYIPLMLPIAALGLTRLSDVLTGRARRRKA